MTIDDDLPLLRHALEDSLGTRPPRGGAPQDGPSTYWLDNAITRLSERMESGSPEPFASGNVTYLQLRRGRVEARYDYDAVDSDIVDERGVGRPVGPPHRVAAARPGSLTRGRTSNATSPTHTTDATACLTH